MHRNPNNQPPDERNPETLPIAIESYQKEHLFNTKKRTTRGGTSTIHRGSTHADRRPFSTQTTKQTPKPTQTRPSRGERVNPTPPWLPLESINAPCKGFRCLPWDRELLTNRAIGGRGLNTSAKASILTPRLHQTRLLRALSTRPTRKRRNGKAVYFQGRLRA